MTYTPRPGSKTEAAINHIREQGGWASYASILTAGKIDLRNLPALFRAPVENGMIAQEVRDGKRGYKLLPIAEPLAFFTAVPVPDSDIKPVEVPEKPPRSAYEYAGILADLRAKRRLIDDAIRAVEALAA